MKEKLLIAALAMVGGCDHQFGIGAFEPDAGVAMSGREAGASPIDLGADALTASVGGMDAQSLLANDAGGGVPSGDSADAGVFRPLVPGPTTWTGYVDGYQFPSGSNAIRLALSVDANGRVTGIAVLGDGSAPPLVTDPNVGYPPDYYPANGVYWAEGFAYSVVGTSAPWRLEFSITSGELWSGWCAAQTPVDGSSTCLPNWSGDHVIGTNGSPDQCYQQDPTNGRKTVVDCGKYDLCITDPVCTCSTTACSLSPNSGIQAIFYLAIPDNTATGTVSGMAGTVAAVHFTQDS